MLSFHFQEVSGRLFFFVFRDPGKELWTSDGTPEGTGPIASLPSMPSGLGRMVEFRGQLFFILADAEHGTELWTSDGTPGGTRLFKDIAPGPASSYPSQLMVVGGTLYFAASDQVHGEELWAARGLNPVHTSMVKDFMPGSVGSPATLLAGLHGDLYFTLHSADQSSDLELWRTNGSLHGTVRVKRIPSPNPELEALVVWHAFPAGNGVRTALAMGNSVYFVIQPVSTNGPWAGAVQLWRTDGTPSGTRYLMEGLRFGDEGPIPELFAAERTLLFAAVDEQHGRELWSSQGTAPGTRLLQDLLPGPGWSYPSSFVQAGHIVYFLASGDRLWALPVKSLRCHPLD
jgi:ELWxxDGT repeat protein